MATIENTNGMTELVSEFCEEAFTLFDDLEEILDDLEDDPLDSELYEAFGQIIDRVMGAAKALEFEEVALFCELGKIVGYKASQTKDKELLKVVTAVLFDSIDLLKGMVKKIQTEDEGSLKGLNTQTFGKRLKWISEKFKNIERSSCALEKSSPTQKASGEALPQASIDDLIENLGL